MSALSEYNPLKSIQVPSADYREHTVVGNPGSGCCANPGEAERRIGQNTVLLHVLIRAVVVRIGQGFQVFWLNRQTADATKTASSATEQPGGLRKLSKNA